MVSEGERESCSGRTWEGNGRAEEQVTVVGEKGRYKYPLLPTVS
jgi:hypothetical protein